MAMKRTVSLLLSAALLLGLLSACRRADHELAVSSGDVVDCPVTELVSAAFDHSGQEDLESLEGYYAEENREWLEEYMANAYGFQDPWVDAAAIRAAGASAFEIAVVKFEDVDAAARAAAELESYLDARQGDFAGYAPAEADMAASGKIMQMGPYAALFICPDSDGARRAVEAALKGEGISVPEDISLEDAITDVRELRDYLVAGTEFAEAELTDLDGDAMIAYVQDTYGISPDQWEDCAVVMDTEGSAFEIAVFRVEAAVGNVEQNLNIYLNEQEAQFDPSSNDAKMLHQAITIVSGDYVVMLACPDAEDMAWAFAQASGIWGYGYSQRYHQYLYTDPNYPDRCAFTAPNNDDMSLYDTSAIRAAWNKGDPAGLSDYDRKIYDAAQEILRELLTDGMDDLEKELAIYGWLVDNVDYDWRHQNIMATTPRLSYEPYGGLVDRTAVCLGYATSFQLLMDMAGVECITVPGAAFSSQEDHAWNMVRLNGEWYCVDVTWDANMREQSEQAGLDWPEEYWNYFNVTSDEMAESHQWDYANIPEATATDRGRG